MSQEKRQQIIDGLRLPKNNKFVRQYIKSIIQI